MFFVTKAYHEREVSSLNATIDELEEESDNYRRNWIEEHNKVKQLETQCATVNQDKINLQQELSEALSLYYKMSSQVMTLGPENKILRQILEDVTGKSADELIEAHKRAVRILEYGVKVPELSKDKTNN